MGIDPEDRSDYSGTVVVKLEVVVRVSGSSADGSMPIVRAVAEDEARKFVQEALDEMEPLETCPIDSAKVETAEAAVMSVEWPAMMFHGVTP